MSYYIIKSTKTEQIELTENQCHEITLMYLKKLIGLTEKRIVKNNILMEKNTKIRCLSSCEIDIYNAIIAIEGDC